MTCVSGCTEGSHISSRCFWFRSDILVSSGFCFSPLSLCPGLAGGSEVGLSSCWLSPGGGVGFSGLLSSPSFFPSGGGGGGGGGSCLRSPCFLVLSPPPWLLPPFVLLFLFRSGDTVATFETRSLGLRGAVDSGLRPSPSGWTFFAVDCVFGVISDL